MSTYLAFFVKSFKKSLAYRSQVWLSIVGNCISIAIQIAIWKALLGSGSVSGVSLPNMIIYTILNTAVAAVLMNGLISDANKRLNTGDIALDLLKPLHYPLYLFIDQLGKSAFRLIFTALPTLLIAGLFFGFTAPASFSSGLAFFVALLIALLISFALGYLIALLSFWFLTTMHFEWTFIGLMAVFSGSYLPIWFFPPGWLEVAQALPFQFLGYVPAALYMGKIPGGSAWLTLSIGMAWALGLLGLTGWLWSTSMKRLVVQGG
ncbi:daunorubicin ABC transporter permease [Dictyobacter sp. S3.2.2.5]|uniref:Daunorubicin ABC transporter permease n=1 Tax=Dictyobacter halimunensis TaxID=3026934 RepID=A0ABQ6FIW5_9CHLR|nr:daunorubicin ABC transporter permease [Dictyobacter sp. S3.2.2.5]